MPDQPSSSTNFLFSGAAWKQRLVFWAGRFSKRIYQEYQWLSFVVAPLRLALIAGLTFRFFRNRYIQVDMPVPVIPCVV